MAIIKKNEQDIIKMRIAGKLAAQVLDYITPFVKEGVTTLELDRLCYDYIVNVQDAIPAPLNYQPHPSMTPYPYSICTSLNYEICHGYPTDKPLKNGDIVNIDVTVIKNGYHGDTSRMFCIGQVSDVAKRLIEVTYKAMYKGIEQVKPGNFVGDIGHAIQIYAQSEGYSVVREFCGHGIGTGFHEDPQILHYGRAKSGIRLETGMIFTIEPMINQFGKDIKMAKNGWVAMTKDKGLSAQWEHTVLVTDKDYEILTLS